MNADNQKLKSDIRNPTSERNPKLKARLLTLAAVFATHFPRKRDRSPALQDAGALIWRLRISARFWSAPAPAALFGFANDPPSTTTFHFPALAAPAAVCQVSPRRPARHPARRGSLAPAVHSGHARNRPMNKAPPRMHTNSHEFFRHRSRSSGSCPLVFIGGN